MVRSGVYGYDDRGHPRFDIIGYTATREEGNIMLAEYNRDPWDVDKAKITLQGLFDLMERKKGIQGWEDRIKRVCVRRSSIVQSC